MRPLWQTTVTSSEDDGGLLRSIWLRKSREANTGDNFSREKRKRAPPKSREMPSPQEPVLDEAAEVSPLQTSPPKEWYKQKVHESAKEVQQLKKKVKTLHQKKRRLSKRIDASQDLIEQLKEQNLLSEKGLEKARLQAYGAQRRHKAVAASFCPEQYGRRRVSATSLRYMGGYVGPPLQKF
ncbi:hypothetical protein HPB51_004341 [Rhipicephalus microplus]|uniref:Uncharacterized protein n=1 Tax=Rhipicephalus microplus TaxID=6941 RepID=A0A9J6ELU7_RHIMP|nr:hypothetical protein HPB51_004341 [Rhipicephalus microplus]